MKEDFIQNIQFDLFSVELVIGETATLLLAENYVQDAITELGNNKQDTLVSGTNIKTINGESVLGSGNIEIQGGGSIEHNDTLNKNVNPNFLHATQAQHDRWTNNYSYKIEDTSVSTWAASTAYAGYGFQAQINIPNLTENDIVSVVFAGVDAISGNYFPTIQIYEGYILIFSKVNATITIPTIEITKIDL